MCLIVFKAFVFLFIFRVSSNAVAVLDPFLRFVFLQPKQPAEYAGLRSGLMSALVTVVMETEGVWQQVFDYLVGMLQGLQVCDTCYEYLF